MKIVTNKVLLREAAEILKNNWRVDHTIPSSKLYPHQWSWDSAFIAIGLAHIDQEKAQSELLSLFEGQWKNGMVPHIIFREKGDYFPGPKFWDASRSKDAPRMKTSGITQPPVHAISAWHIYKTAHDKQSAKTFLSALYPKLLSFHRFLLTERDPEESGLITIFHPWESGLDNSVRWGDALAGFEAKRLSKYSRVDTRDVESAQRPSDDAYNKYVYLVELMRKSKYDQKEIYENIPFRVKDIAFTSILYVANKSLLHIARMLGESTSEILKWQVLTEKNYFDYFCGRNPKNHLGYDFDLVNQKRIEKRTVASLIPLYTGMLHKKEARQLVTWLNHAHVCDKNCVHEHPAVTSLSVKEKEFSPLNYWRGPVWININWMIYQGMKAYGFKESKKLRSAIVELVREHGFYEYYNPLTGAGLGIRNFAWTAALTIDFLEGD